MTAMWQAVRRALLYHFKILEMRWKTWRNSQEINRAYTGRKKGRRRICVGKIGAVGGVVGGVCLVAVAGALLSRGSYVSESVTGKAEETRPSEHNGLDAPDVSAEKVHREQPLKPVSQADAKPQPRATSVKSENTEGWATADSALKRALDEAWYPPDSMPYLLLANKADKRVYLLRKKESWKVMRAYAAAYGEKKGRKRTSGDKRTPEGIYFIVGHKKPREMTEIYGPVAFVLNYPNAADRRAGRTGKGIWIHGTAPDSMPVSTRGCIELNNHNIRELERIVGNGIGTPVIIVNDSTISDAAAFPDYREIAWRRGKVMRDYCGRLEEFARFVQQWRKAWESQDIEHYRIFYDTTEFAAQGLEWPGWRARKLRTFRNYDTIAVSVNNIMLSDFEPDRAIVKFHQVYRSNILTSRNVKALFLTHIDGSWKIRSEATLPAEEFLL
ncbi:MAG: L,D-transpeptidase family protein [Chitinivibrionales bacterium]|nr:L,D-transpeptidase family protein [Chitinivibrionales bacterium]MBD3357188.1 L,D-transpeptidase family protein [Chitinivibrionales bacterium]